MEENEFFDQLIEKTSLAYKKSPVYEKHGHKNWNYAICDTPIKKGKDLLFGLNWGGNNHPAQKSMPKNYDRNFSYAKHADRYLNKYLDINLEDLNYSNLCFFRTPKSNLLEKKDWELSLPLFKEYVEFIKPPRSIMFGKPNNLLRENIKELNSVEFNQSKKKAFAYTGLLFGKYPFASVPHPSSTVTNEGRHFLWSEIQGYLNKHEPLQ